MRFTNAMERNRPRHFLSRSPSGTRSNQAVHCCQQENRSRLLGFREAELQEHFQREKALLPLLAEFTLDDNALTMEALTQHVAVRRRVAGLRRAGADTSVEGIQEIGLRLRNHVRFEERSLFPATERLLPAGYLSGLLSE